MDEVVCSLRRIALLGKDASACNPDEWLTLLDASSGGKARAVLAALDAQRNSRNDGG